uniref:Si:dkeyp-74a11.1 n=1 Tax=Sinocyclocheilus anshuiensis TaxID=1608454 RepID=A0A671SSK6_9TELE
MYCNILNHCSSVSDLSMGDLQDPFLVSIHIITDPGQAKTLQQAADQVLSWLHPDLTLFRVSERAGGLSRKPKVRLQRVTEPPSHQPALAVILFLQDEYGGEESFERLHSQLRCPPWRYHHTERVNGRGLLPFSPASQDFVTLAPGTPLWALRQVHYGKEIVRFTVYCCYETYTEQVRLYRLLLRRRLAQKKEDFCFCVVFSNPETEIQLSFKRMPRGQNPVPTENAVIEIRVRDVGELVPLLPQPCTPISDVRWQTNDYDGNKILLQVRQRIYYWKIYLKAIVYSYLIKSLFSLPTDESRSSCASPSSFRPRCFSSMAAPIFRVNVDTLVGAEETDVDTGKTISGSSVDLSVVSGYSHPQQRPHLKAPAPRPKSAPPTDGGLDFADLTYNNTSQIRQTPVPSRTQSIFAKSTPCVVHKPQPKNVKDVLQDKGQQNGNGVLTVNDCSQEGTVEEEQEFYI